MSITGMCSLKKEMVFDMKKTLPLLIAVGLLLPFANANADTIVKPNTFSAGTPANADQVNANFDTVYDQVNKVGAAINVDQPTGNVGIGTVPGSSKLEANDNLPGPVLNVVNNGNSNVTPDTSQAIRGTNTVSGNLGSLGSMSSGVFGKSIGTSSAVSGLNLSGTGNAINGFALAPGYAGNFQGDVNVTGQITVQDLQVPSGAVAGRVLTSDAAGNATWQLNDPDSENELNESFALTGTILEIEDSGSLLGVDLAPLVNDADADPTNELQTLSRNSTNISLFPSGGSVSIADNDNDSANELQTIGRAGTDVMLSNGGGMVSIADNDNDSTNELITAFSIGSGVLQLSDAAGTRFVDLSDQLSINSLSDAKTGTNSIFLGSGSGAVDGGLNFNVAVGVSALAANTTGPYNTATGYQALLANTDGGGNTANGYSALRENITGSYNTAVGYFTLTNNTSGNFNTALGRYALASNTIGDNNTATGPYALYVNSTAGKNTALGMYTLYNQSFSNNNTAYDSYNTAVGFEALYSNEPTATNNGNQNTAIGSLALHENTTGSRNTASGHEALNGNDTGYWNTATGFEALYSNTSGYRNTAIGHQALFTNTTGYNNTAIGNAANVTANNLTNATVIGYNASVNASNKVRVGNTAVTVIEGQVAWSYPSDERLKKDIQDVGLGLDFISSLRPVEYRMKSGNGRTDLGFIAQDIEELIGTDYNVLGIDEDEDRTPMA